MNRRLFTLSAIASSTAALAQNKSKLPAPYATPSVSNGPKIIEKPADAKLNLPPGFVATEFSSGFLRPRYMVVSPSGHVLLSDTVANGTVYSINKDGSHKKLLEGLDRPFGMVFHKDQLYLGEATTIKRYSYDPKGGGVLGKGQEVVSLTPFSKGHTTRTLLIDEKAGKLYVTVGSGSNAEPDDDPRRAAINQYNLDGTGHVIYAGGLRNVVGLRVAPGTNTLWATVQERDGLGDELVPDYFTSIRQGGFYGWPYAYVGPNEDPTLKGKAPDKVAATIAPDHLLGSHVAVMDFLFYTGKQFPAKYRNGAFLAFHGSNNRSTRTGYSIVYIPFKNGKIAGPQEDFLTGWMLGADQREVWGRPVGLCQLPDGGLLLSDDGGKKVWKISYKG